MLNCNSGKKSEIKRYQKLFAVSLLVSWQATQKCDVKYIVKKMDLNFLNKPLFLLPIQV